MKKSFEIESSDEGVAKINEKNLFKGYALFPFGQNAYTDLNDMYRIIEEKCNEKGKKYIYAYDTDPDHTMHEIGCDKEEIKTIIRDIDKRIEKLSSKIKDTIIFVVADHGHKNIINIDEEITYDY